MNIGSSGSLVNDQCAYDDRLTESVTPLNYNLEFRHIETVIHNLDN